MATVLIVEDDKNTRLLTKSRLKSQFNVIEAENGLEAITILEHQQVDIIVADIMMPYMDGYQFLKTVREEGNLIPVILLTAKQTFEDKKVGFASGTDDYMTKPINYEELLWRIQALLRRARINSENRIVIADVLIDSTTYSLTKQGQKLFFARKEFELLYLLLSYPGQIFTKGQILDKIWGYDSVSDENTIKTHINRLRSKLSDFSEFDIVTIRGLGYKAEIKADL